MFIGHLPAGYIGGKLLYPRFAGTGVKPWAFIGAGLLGAAAPDFDMAYFIFIDHGQHHHHSYWTHWPSVWFSLLIAAGCWFALAQRKAWPTLAVIFALSGCVHMFLDTIVSDMWWLAPFSDKTFVLVEVAARYQPWWWNFLLHWSMLLEFALVGCAIWLWRRGAGRESAAPQRAAGFESETG